MNELLYPFELKIIQKLSQSLSLTFELDELINLILQLLYEAIPLAESAIFIPDDKKENEFVCYKLEKTSFFLSKANTHLSKELVEKVKSLRKIILFEIDNHNFINIDIDNFSYSADSKYKVIVPVIYKDKLLGIIEILYREGEGCSKSNLIMFTILASQMAVMLEHIRLDKANLEAERMAAIGYAITSITHCVKNILNGIQSSSYIIDKGLKKFSFDEISNGWHKLKANINRMNDLVMDMLNYSKNRIPDVKVCNAEKVIREIINLLGDKAALENVVIKTDTDKRIPDIIIDCKGLYRCMLNLITNAIDACSEMEKQGEILISTLDMPEKKQFEIHIKDNGHGISEENISLIFNPFFSTKGFKGTGFGLAVSKKVIEEQGGAIKVFSTQQKGTEFIVTLPRISALESGKIEPKTILVVDDEPDSLEFVKNILDREEYRVITANNGIQGEKLAIEEKPDLVILDIIMPGKDGFNVFYDLKRNNNFNSPIIMFTSINQFENYKFDAKDMENFYSYRPEAFIDKPIDPENLLEIINRIFTQQDNN